MAAFSSKERHHYLPSKGIYYYADWSLFHSYDGNFVPFLERDGMDDSKATVDLLGLALKVRRVPTDPLSRVFQD